MNPSDHVRPKVPRRRLALVLWLFLFAGPSLCPARDDLILNEYNCVSSANFLRGGGRDSAFGRVQSNGGNWLELVVLEDHLDVRGWQLRWAEALEDPVFPPRDLWYGDGSVKQGVITFGTNAAPWADLRAGTILTITEDAVIRSETGSNVVSGTDTSFNPAGGDWWIHVSTLQEAGRADPLISTAVNAAGDSPGNFSVGHESWQFEIVDAAGTNVFGPVGEGVTNWGGGNIASDELGQLAVDPWDSGGNADYDDTTNSTFATPNPVGRGAQDFRAPRGWFYFTNSSAGLVINEYNAVEPGLGFEAPGADSRLGAVPGNGGNWIELVVTADHLDLRGWQLKWAEEGGTNAAGPDLWYGNAGIEQGIITFSTNAALWSDLRSGTILTLGEEPVLRDQNGALVVSGSETNTSPRARDFWIHVSTRWEAEQARPLVTAVNNNGAGPGGFSVGSAKWQASLFDARGRRVLGPVGEVYGWGGGNLRNIEAARLEDDPDGTVRIRDYADGSSSTFGAPNTWSNGERVQDFSRLLAWAPHPPDLQRIGDKIVEVDHPLSFAVEALATDGDPLRLSVSNAPAGACFATNGTGGVFTWVPQQAGQFRVTFAARDIDGADRKTVDIFVVEPPGASPVLLNEVLVNPPGSDDNREYVELKGPPGRQLDGLWLLAIDGDGENGGVVDLARDLRGLRLGANGLLVLGRGYTSQPPPYSLPPDTAVADLGTAEDFENGTLTLLLVSNFTVTAGTDLDFDDNGVLEMRPWSAVLDGVGWRDPDNLDAVYTPARLVFPGDSPEAATRMPCAHDAEASFFDAWYWGRVTTTATDRVGLTYSTNRTAVSANLPAGARLTPGAFNDPDADGDGMPDDWERQALGSTTNTASGDRDGDGLDNLSEFQAATDPADPDSALWVESCADGAGLVLSWRGAGGRFYRLQECTDLAAGAWRTLGRPAAGADALISRGATNGLRKAYYRVGVGWR